MILRWLLTASDIAMYLSTAAMQEAPEALGVTGETGNTGGTGDGTHQPCI